MSVHWRIKKSEKNPEKINTPRNDCGKLYDVSIGGNFNISLSGMGAAAGQLAVSASNVARGNVPGAMPDQVALEDLRQGGVQTTRMDRLKALRDEQMMMDATETSGIDPAQEAIYQIIGKNMFGANVEMAKSSLSMYSHILNVHV